MNIKAQILLCRTGKQRLISKKVTKFSHNFPNTLQFHYFQNLFADLREDLLIAQVCCRENSGNEITGHGSVNCRTSLAGTYNLDSIWSLELESPLYATKMTKFEFVNKFNHNFLQIFHKLPLMGNWISFRDLQFNFKYSYKCKFIK